MAGVWPIDLNLNRSVLRYVVIGFAGSFALACFK